MQFHGSIFVFEKDCAKLLAFGSCGQRGQGAVFCISFSSLRFYEIDALRDEVALPGLRRTELLWKYATGTWQACQDAGHRGLQEHSWFTKDGLGARKRLLLIRRSVVLWKLNNEKQFHYPRFAISKL